MKERTIPQKKFGLIFIVIGAVLLAAGGTIFLTLSRTPVTVSASIRDQGRGIAPDDLEKVKQKFFKAKNSVRGSGIGLAVVDEIVGTLGGKFDIASTLGQGTTVTVTLPVYHPGQEHLHDKI